MKRVLAAALVVGTSLIFTSSPASAACAKGELTNPERARGSEKQRVVFVGVVEELSNFDRSARVRVEKVKKKQGGADLPEMVDIRSGSEDPTIATSADLTFVLGARYEFFPRNDTSPFVVDACTATQKETKPGKFERHFSSGFFGASPSLIDQGHLDSSRHSSSVSGMAMVMTVGVAVPLFGLLLFSRARAQSVHSRRRLAWSLGVVAAATLWSYPAQAGHQLTIFGRVNNHWGRAAPPQATPGIRDQTGAPATWGNLIRDAVNRWNANTNHVDVVYFGRVF